MTPGQTVSAGTIVSLSSGSSRQIELATTSSADRLVGVVESEPLVTITSQDQQQTAQVVISGTAEVYVSDLNGHVKAGDKIAISPVAGVGMLATTDTQIIGTAQTDLTSARGQTRTIKDRSGKTRRVQIARLPVQIGLAYYRAPGSDFLPPFIQRLAYSVAGRPVSLLRIMVSFLLLFSGLIGFAVILFTAIRGAMTAIGRNPLASMAVRRGLYQTGGLAIALLVCTTLVAYLVLAV
ncbi:MAG TPA: hypothetical protein VI322_01080 [Candidatus Saccharimonadia bacterium]